MVGILAGIIPSKTIMRSGVIKSVPFGIKNVHLVGILSDSQIPQLSMSKMNP